MMNRVYFLAVTGTALLRPNAEQTPEGAAQIVGGRTYIQPFASAPYPHVSRASGHDYQGRHYGVAGHYDDSTVGIFIPEAFEAAGGGLDFIVHFYGWRHDVRSTFGRYRLREQVVASGRNAILLVPEGPKNVPDSGDGKLELDPDGFARFMSDVAAWLHAQRIVSTQQLGRIVLSAHSGGYGGAGGVLKRGGLNDRISDVLLFDAAYGYYDAFTTWVKASPQHHLLSLFTDDTSTGNAALMAGVQGPQPNVYVRLADTMTLAELQTRAPTFVLTTNVAHDDLLQKYDWYSLFLQTTALSRRSGTPGT